MVTATDPGPAYAELEDLLAFFSTKPKPERQARLRGLLAAAADELNDELKIDFFRHPTTGSASWLVDGDGTDVLHLHRGVIELDLVEISYDSGLTFVALEATDWALRSDAYSADAPLSGEPYFHLVLLVSGSYRTVPRGRATVRLTGASGWATAPRALVVGNAERARQLAAADPAYQGEIPSDDDQGRPSVSGRWPDVLYRYIERHRRRFYACEL